MKNYISFLLINSIVFLFTACDSSTYTIVEEVPTSVKQTSGELTTENLNGIVVNGYINNSTVCSDIDNDGNCDNQTSISTNEDGTFTLNSSREEDNTLITILAEGDFDITANTTMSEQLRKVVDTASLNDNSKIIISPFTDLVTCSFLNSNNKDLIALNDSKIKVANLLGISTNELDQDSLKNIELFLKTQQLQYIKLFVEKVILKNTLTLPSSSDKIKLQNNIKKYILEFYPKTKRILISTAENQDPSIIVPDNEELFIVEQIEKLKDTLNALAQNAELKVSHLSRLQELLHIKMQEVFTKLEESKDGEAIGIVDLTITVEDLTQTIFDTKDAILDDYACVASANYNVLENTTLLPTKTDDTNNGISIRSNLDNNGTLDSGVVTIFYPDLEHNKIDDRVIVFQEDEYYFVFDEAWVNNDNNTIYIMIPKDDNNLSSCYRYKLNSLNGTEVASTKVFSYSDL